MFAAERYERMWKVRDITVRSGAVWSTIFDMELKDPDTGEEATLRLPRSYYEKDQWKVGDQIYVIGRTGLFGKIANEVRSGTYCKRQT